MPPLFAVFGLIGGIPGVTYHAVGRDQLSEMALVKLEIRYRLFSVLYKN